MKKKIKFLLISTLLFPVHINAASNNDEEIESLRKEIYILEEELEELKAELELKLDSKSIDIDWKDVDIDISKDFLGEPTLTKIVRMGIDNSGQIPIFNVIFYNEIIGTEKMSPDIAISASLQVETDSYLDWAEHEEYGMYLEKNNDEYFESNKDLPTKVAPGWSGYFLRSWKLSEPEGEYHMVDGTLGGYDYKMAVYGTDEEMGTMVELE